jgi:hypothetical protein
MTAIMAGVLLVSAAAFALWLFERYAGEHPLFDALYDARLRLTPLSALDRRAAANPRRSDLVVSLTTLPSRIDRIGPTVKSLLNQRVAPAAIRLNVPAASRREGVAYRPPEWLTALRSITIVPCDDYGPATKLIPTLLAPDPPRRILVVDDDRIYQPTIVEQAAAWSDAHPDAAVAGSGWEAPADLVDRPSTLAATIAGRPPAPIKCTRLAAPREVDIVQGLSGYVVKPSFFDAAALADYSGAPEAAFFVDDVWISAHCAARKLVCPGRRTNFPSLADARFFKRSSVALVNRGGGVHERRNNTVMLRHFASRWRVSRQAPPASRELEA